MELTGAEEHVLGCRSGIVQGTPLHESNGIDQGQGVFLGNKQRDSWLGPRWNVIFSFRKLMALSTAVANATLTTNPRMSATRQLTSRET